MTNQGDITEKTFTIRCECGFEIPVVPNMDAVGCTIDAHVEEHRKKQPDQKKGEFAAKHIHDYLFRKLFEKINKLYK